MTSVEVVRDLFHIARSNLDDGPCRSKMFRLELRKPPPRNLSKDSLPIEMGEVLRLEPNILAVVLMNIYKVVKIK